MVVLRAGSHEPFSSMIYQINMVMFCSCVKLLESSSMFFEIFKAKSQSADGSLIFI